MSHPKLTVPFELTPQRWYVHLVLFSVYLPVGVDAQLGKLLQGTHKV